MSHLNPLFLLDNLLLSLVETHEHGPDSNRGLVAIEDSGALQNTKKRTRQRLVLLEAADFLVGDSLLDAALTLLDSSTYSMAPAVRLIRAHPSNRCLFRVRASASSQSTHDKRRRGGDSTLEYICLLGSPYPTSSSTTSVQVDHHDQTSIVAAGRTGYYCSCRSFFERCKGDPSGASLCKHLLAVRLAPFLVDESDQYKCYMEETVTDEEYADVVTSRLCN